MKRTLFLAAASLSLALCGCTALTAATSGQPVATGQVAVDMSKGWYYAESLYNVPAAAYKSTNSRGLISPSLRAIIKPKLILLFQLLTGVKHAKAAGDAASFGAKIKAMETLSADVKALIPKR